MSNLRWPVRYRFVCVVVLILAGCALRAGAQTNAGIGLYEEQLRVRLDEQIPEAREIGLDAGGWFSFALFRYDDAAGRKVRTLRQYELRPWASLNIRGEHKFYVRGIVGYDDWNTGDNPNGEKGDHFRSPKLERAWYQFDLGQALRNRTGRRPPVGFKFKVGRQFAHLGTALVLSMPLDMVQFELSAGDWQAKALLGKTITHTRNIDDSPRVSDHQDRCIWGAQLTYAGFDDHRPFAYFLSNHDNTDPWGADPFQSYDYSSRYVGVGSEGTLLLPHLRYQAEIVGEWGKTYSRCATTGRDDIRAMAMDVMLEYLFQTRTHPRVMVEYIYGSGDDDRFTSATATVGGNQAGTIDRAFNAFGFRDTGIAFAPRISNLHIYVAGASFFPLEGHPLFKKLEVGSKVFFYHKAAKSGPISDTTGVNDARCVGWEWDIFCNWRISSDVAWTIRYGAFRPGESFDDRSCRQFLYTGVTYSF